MKTPTELFISEMKKEIQNTLRPKEYMVIKRWINSCTNYAQVLTLGKVVEKFSDQNIIHGPDLIRHYENKLMEKNIFLTEKLNPNTK